jgi:predicted ribosome quality control (RQC) complex YloA/Tae2 family protein
MAFDGLVVHAVVHELQNCVGGKIHKIHQPNEHDFIFTIRVRGATLKLLVSANPTYPRMHLTERSFQNPLEAPMFCMLLRKHCENGHIESIEQVGMERIIVMHIRQRDELGDLSMKQLIVEIMGRHSNIILSDPVTNKVLEAIHRVTPAISSHRLIVPGSLYVKPPEQAKQNPLTATPAEVIEAIADVSTHDDPSLLLVKAYSGISPLVAREIIHTTHVAGKPDAARIASEFTSVMRAIANHQYKPTVMTDSRGTGKSGFSVIPLHSLEGRCYEFASISQCLEFYYGDKAERDTVKQRTVDLQRLIANEKIKNEKKIKKLQETWNEAQDADHYRVWGELLNACLHTFNKGDTRVCVVNYYDEDMNDIVIALDPMLDPSENAQRYFRKYQKLKKSLSIVQNQLKQTHQEIQYLDSLQQQLEDSTLNDIEEIRLELIEGGYVRDRRTNEQRKPRKSDKLRLLGYLSSEDIPIYVGKNNTQNDYITNRLARPTDTWLHVKDMPGSHVVIRSDTFSEITLHEAANAAAYYSKARQSSGVPVDHTLIRHVKKPSGAKPGFVTYEKQRTVYITPDEEQIKRLRMMK